MKRLRIGIVVQRYGEEVNGGAELAARGLAEHLQYSADVEVITTCAVDYTTWANVYPPGESYLNGVSIHRFPVDAARNWSKFTRQTRKILNRTHHNLYEEIEWVKSQGPFSTSLLQFIQEAHSRLDIFIFFTYHYATTFFGLPLVSDKAILVPTAHDDPLLTLPVFRHLFHLPQILVYLTEPERDSVHRVTHNECRPHIVAGVGVEIPDTQPAQPFRHKYGFNNEFLLYVGRIHESKNVSELIDYFLHFREQWQKPLKLILIGKAHLTLPQHPDILHLGFVSEEDKFEAIKAATVVVMPSENESLSIIALEAWLMTRPMLVNGRCDVLKYQCRRSNGGLYYHTYDEFEIALQRLLESADLRRQLGRQGHQYVAAHYGWNVITAKYHGLFTSILEKNESRSAKHHLLSRV